MNREEARERIKQLTAEIVVHNHNYYDLSRPTITDYEFDNLLDELILLEKEYPEFADPASPSERVGGGITKEFHQVRHNYPMLSLGKTILKKRSGILKNVFISFWARKLNMCVNSNLMASLSD